MRLLVFLHLLAICLWFGSAAADIVIEIYAWKKRSAAFSRTTAVIHEKIDLFLEGPAILLTLLTGFWLILHPSSGYLISWGRWPYWLQQKIFFGLIAAAINFFCIFCVLQRKRYDAVNSSKRVFYDRCVRLSILGVPFAALALWYASQRYFS